MKTLLIVFFCCLVVCLVLSVYGIYQTVVCYGQYKAFNENVKQWAIEIEQNADRTLWLAANRIIDEQNEKNGKDDCKETDVQEREDESR